MPHVTPSLVAHHVDVMMSLCLSRLVRSSQVSFSICFMLSIPSPAISLLPKCLALYSLKIFRGRTFRVTCLWGPPFTAFHWSTTLSLSHIKFHVLLTPCPWMFKLQLPLDITGSNFQGWHVYGLLRAPITTRSSATYSATCHPHFPEPHIVYRHGFMQTPYVFFLLKGMRSCF